MAKKTKTVRPFEPVELPPEATSFPQFQRTKLAQDAAAAVTDARLTTRRVPTTQPAATTRPAAAPVRRRFEPITPGAVRTRQPGIPRRQAAAFDKFATGLTETRQRDLFTRLESQGGIDRNPFLQRSQWWQQRQIGKATGFQAETRQEAFDFTLSGQAQAQRQSARIALESRGLDILAKEQRARRAIGEWDNDIYGVEDPTALARIQAVKKAAVQGKDPIALWTQLDNLTKTYAPDKVTPAARRQAVEARQTEEDRLAREKDVTVAAEKAEKRFFAIRDRKVKSWEGTIKRLVGRLSDAETRLSGLDRVVDPKKFPVAERAVADIKGRIQEAEANLDAIEAEIRTGPPTATQPAEAPGAQPAGAPAAPAGGQTFFPPQLGDAGIANPESEAARNRLVSIYQASQGTTAQKESFRNLVNTLGPMDSVGVRRRLGTLSADKFHEADLLALRGYLVSRGFISGAGTTDSGQAITDSLKGIADKTRQIDNALDRGR